MTITDFHLVTFLRDPPLKDFIHDLTLLEDKFGINFIPSPTDERLLLSRFQQAWTNIFHRIKYHHPYVYHFLLEHTFLLDREEFAPTYIASIRILSSKIDQISAVKTIFSTALILLDPNSTPLYTTTINRSTRATEDIKSLANTLFQVINTS